MMFLKKKEIDLKIAKIGRVMCVFNHIISPFPTSLWVVGVERPPPPFPCILLVFKSPALVELMYEGPP